MRPVILGTILGVIFAAIFTFATPGGGEWITVIGLGAVLGALFAFLMVNILLPVIETRGLYVWLTASIAMLFGIWLTFFNTDYFSLSTHFSIGSGLVTAGLSTLLYYTELVNE